MENKWKSMDKIQLGMLTKKKCERVTKALEKKAFKIYIDYYKNKI